MNPRIKAITAGPGTGRQMPDEETPMPDEPTVCQPAAVSRPGVRPPRTRE